MRALLLIFALLWPVTALAQEDDKGTLTRMLQDALSGAGREVVIDGFQGALSAQATLSQMTISDDTGVWLTLKDATLDWNRAALLRGRIEINRLSAAEIYLPRLPASEPSAPSPEATPFALPDLPVSVNIGTLQIDKITLGKDVLGHPLEARLAGSVALADGQGTTRLQILRTDDVSGEISLLGGFANETRNLDINLKVTEAQDGLIANLANLPGKPSLSLSIEGSGPIQTIETRIALDTDGQPRLQGTVATQVDEETGISALYVDIGGDLTPLFAPDYRAFFGQNISLTSVLRQIPDGSTRLDQLLLTSRALTLSGDLVLAPNRLPQRFALDIALADPEAESILLPLPGARTSLGSANLKARYDAERGNTWTLSGDILNLVQPDLTIGQTVLAGQGVIAPDAPKSITAAFSANATGITATDPANDAVAAAIGDTALFTLRSQWREGGPLEIERLGVETADSALRAKATIKGPATNPTINTSILANISDLAGLRPIAQRALSGQINADVNGTLMPLAGSFDLAAQVTGSNLKLDHPQADALLEGTSRISVSVKRDDTGVSIPELSVLSDAVSATGTALLRTGQSRYDLSVELDELARIVPDISGPVSLTSAGIETDLGWDATLEATGPGATRLSATATTRQSLINARIDAVTQALSDLFPDLKGNSALQAEVSQIDDGWRFQTSGTGPAGTSLESSGTLSADFATGALVAKGDFPLAALNRMLKPTAIQGTAAFDLALDGALSPENLRGTIRTGSTRLSLPDVQMALNNVRAQITLANGNADLSVDGDVAAGGAISVRGNTTLTAPFIGNISTSLQSVRVKYEALAETILNGEVTLSGPLTGGALIAGDILLDPTEIRVSTTSGSGSAGTAITHIGEPASVRRTRDRAGVIATASGGTPTPFDLNLAISAPNRFFVRGLGLDSEFGGALTLTGTTAAPIASGEFELLRGRLDFLARRFDLTEGLVTLAGGFTPDIRLVASTESADATFDIILEGSADAPEISITSSPEMAEDEALAQLLFGSSASEISPLQAARLANAVASLSGGGGGNLFGGLRNSVGIDDLDVSTDADGQTEVTAGKYINDNIYSEIGIDGEGNSSISLNLDVTRNLTVKGQVGADANTGIGLFYQKDY